MHRGRWFIYDLGTSVDHNPETAPMSFPIDLLIKFRDINQSVPDLFLDNLTDILRKEEELGQAQHLPRGDLNIFVEDLDRVCERITFVFSSLNGVVGPRPVRPHWLHLLSMLV